MVYTEYNGKKLNKSAIEFFDKLAYHESTDNYRLVNKGSKYMGRYQVDTELMSDLKWYENGEFIKEAKGKWNLNSKKDFLESPGAQDDLIMKSMSERWKNLDKYLKNRVQKGILDYVCKEIFISSGVQFVTPGGKPLSAEKIKKVYQNKKNKELGDIRGKKFLVTISGLLVGAHLTGQGGMGRLLISDGKEIAVDGNGTMVLYYMEKMKGHDLSIICNHKDNCQTDDKVVLKNDFFKDEIILKEEMNKGENKAGSEYTPSKIPEKTEKGIYEFKGQKYEEVWDSEFYKQDITGRKQPPSAGYVEAEQAVIKRLEEKFENPDLYNTDYIKYIENKTGKKVLGENKEEINIMLALYDNATKNRSGSGNILRQYGFDVLRGRNESTEPLKIQDIAYYMYYYPISKMGQLETLEYVFSKFSAKYVKFPDIHYTENKKTEEYQISQIAQILKNTGERKEKPVIKYNLPEKYNKYMTGVKDIDEFVLRVSKVEKKNFHKMRSENLLRGLEMAGEHKKSFSTDEAGVRKYPLARRFLDNLLMEFIKVETGFKGEKEEKNFDGHKYRDSNIMRNYLLWYDENFKRIELPHPDGRGMYSKLEKLGKDIRITTILDIWINSKEKNKLKHIRKIHNLIIDNYGDYSDKKTITKDREIITGHFPDVKELRDYAAERDSMNLYSFYREFYDLKNIITPSGEFYVNENGILKCTLGEGISRLNISRESVILHGGKQANIKDKNILPFKDCKAASACRPELLDTWEKNTDTRIGGEPALLDISTIKCRYGGIISIDDSGQRKSAPQTSNKKTSTESKSKNSEKSSQASASVGTAKTKTINSKPSIREVDCSYRPLLEICTVLNKNFMQTSLKKECQNYKKYKKDSDIFEAERRKFYDGIKKAEKEVIKSGNYFEEKLKVERIKKIKKKYDDFITKTEKKGMLASKNSSVSRRNLLIVKIGAVMAEANKKAVEMSVPKKDLKRIIQKYGFNACDYDKRNFYETKILGCIVYGYLKAAMGEKTDEKTQKEIEKDIKKREEEEKKKNTAYPNNKLAGYEIYSEIQKKENEKRQNVKSVLDTQVLYKIGYELYQLAPEMPTGSSILTKIREKVKPVIKCPFDEVERRTNHGEATVDVQASLREYNSGTDSSSDSHVPKSKEAVYNHDGNIGNRASNDHMNGNTGGRAGNTGHNNIEQKPPYGDGGLISKESLQEMVIGDELLGAINRNTGNSNEIKGNDLRLPDFGSSPPKANKPEEKKPDNGVVCSENRCPNVGVSGKYTFMVERIEETSQATLSKFYILDPNGDRLSAYDGYIIEREGPDEKRSGRKKRVCTGEHKLKWRYRPAKRHRYWAPHIYSDVIPAGRMILMHRGKGYYSSTGCLIWAKTYSRIKNKKGKILEYVTNIEKSIEFSNNINEFIHKIEKTSYEEAIVIEIGKYKSKGPEESIPDITAEHPAYKKYEGKSIKNFKIKIINNF